MRIKPKKIDQQKKYDNVGSVFDYISGIFERDIINHAVDLLEIKKKGFILRPGMRNGKST